MVESCTGDVASIFGTILLVALFKLLVVIELHTRLIDDSAEGIVEFGKCFKGHHNRISAAFDVFRDLDELAAIVLFEIEEEDLAVRDDFLAVKWWLVLLS
jgi:hypothetical protein